MLGKILFTLVIILLVFALMRSRSRSGQVSRANANDSAPLSRAPRVMAYSFLALVIALGGGFMYYDWQHSHEVLNLRVINSRTGNSVSYQVYRGDIRGRTFTTMEGVKVSLSDEERVEISAE